MSNTVEINSDSLKSVTLTLVEDGLGGVSREQYEDAVNQVLCSAYDQSDSAWIDINWQSAGSTKIELEFEGYDAQSYEHSCAYDREKEYIGSLLETAYTKACEDAKENENETETMDATEVAEEIIDNADEWGWRLESRQDCWDAAYSWKSNSWPTETKATPDEIGTALIRALDL